MVRDHSGTVPIGHHSGEGEAGGPGKASDDIAVGGQVDSVDKVGDVPVGELCVKGDLLSIDRHDLGAADDQLLGESFFLGVEGPVSEGPVPDVVVVATASLNDLNPLANRGTIPLIPVFPRRLDLEVAPKVGDGLPAGGFKGKAIAIGLDEENH
jgi:hypothetical protein